MCKFCEALMRAGVYMVSGKRRTTGLGFGTVCPLCWRGVCWVCLVISSLFIVEVVVSDCNTRYKDGLMSPYSDSLMVAIEWTTLATRQTWDWVLSKWAHTVLTITIGDSYYQYTHFKETLWWYSVVPKISQLKYTIFSPTPRPLP